MQQGPRSTEVVERVLRATVSELGRVGFADFSMEAVAREAGVNRTTVYRRWPTRSALLGAVVQPLMDRYDAAPDTGSTQHDLELLMRQIRSSSDTPEGRALTAATRAASEELHELVAAIVLRASTPFRTVLQRAADAGLLDQEDVDPATQLAFFGIVMWEQSHSGPATDSDCARLARLIVPGEQTVS